MPVCQLVQLPHLTIFSSFLASVRVTGSQYHLVHPSSDFQIQSQHLRINRPLFPMRGIPKPQPIAYPHISQASAAPCVSVSQFNPKHGNLSTAAAPLRIAQAQPGSATRRRPIEPLHRQHPITVPGFILKCFLRPPHFHPPFLYSPTNQCSHPL